MQLPFEHIRKIARYLLNEEYASPEYYLYLSRGVEISCLKSMQKRGYKFKLYPEETLEDFCIVIPLKKNPLKDIFFSKYEGIRVFYEIRNRNIKKC